MKISRQLEITKKVKKQFTEGRRFDGLCAYFIDNCLTEDEDRSDIKLFTFKNAVKYGNANPKSIRTYFWWKVDDPTGLSLKFPNATENEYDFENRLLFLDWMIKKYESKLLKVKLKKWISKWLEIDF